MTSCSTRARSSGGSGGNAPACRRRRRSTFSHAYAAHHCSASNTRFDGLRAERSRAHTFAVGRFEQ